MGNKHAIEANANKKDIIDTSNDIERVKGNAVEQPFRGKSGGDQMCRFPITGGLHHTAGDAPLYTQQMSQDAINIERVKSNEVEQPFTGKSSGYKMCRFPNTGGLHQTAGDAPLDTQLMSQDAIVIECVNGAAVEQHSWGKSSGDKTCHFPNTGVLHHTAADAPFDSKLMYKDNYKSEKKPSEFLHTNDVRNGTTDPSWCHVHNSDTPSSLRTKVASSAFRIKKSASRTTKHKRRINSSRKRNKQVRFLKEVQVCNIASSNNIKMFTSDYIETNIVVCDGSDKIEDAIQKSKVGSKVQILSIRNGDLWVADTLNSTLGLRFTSPSDNFPIFLRLPRTESLRIMNNGHKACSAMRSCASAQVSSLSRGKRSHVFIDSENKYCCVGAQPGRNQRGVQSGQYRLEQGFENKDWDTLHKLLKRAEHAFDKYLDTDVIRHIACARTRVPFKTMEPSPTSLHQDPSRYYNGIGFGINVFLRCHIDNDFTMSIVQVHIDNSYQVDDRIVCYFAFPRIGIAVALRPGDFLLFNPQEPHSISSRCRAEDELFAVSYYLKTAVVGLNDNKNLRV